VNSSVPVDVSNLASVVQLSAAADYTCALLADATVSCWGNVHYTGNVGVPTSIANLSEARQIGSLSSSGYALLLDGRIVWWSGLSAPAPVSPFVGNVTQIAGGDDPSFLCYLAQGTVECTGDDYVGELGTGDRSGHGVVAGIRNALQIAASDDGHACALLATGELRCWGNDRAGQLGSGVVKKNDPWGIPTPVPVKGFP
jgi:hypothetical protein